ncbi:histidine phosphatase family protein [Kingella sp. SNUBH-2017]|jgi:phosphoglycerate mutase|uniref:histidine phosphatase family protein n=1 Tax=Kingella sp. SNUBH-2017 TaxID=2994077 RepID=UPI002363D2EE|nr:histidine phosphatase family protein [Kingella sp. SNUBH-2017]MDD2183627.1 histidine phosphatase family protein [Kingella sp. SNUBH-2017]
MKNIYLIRHAQSAANAMPSHGGLVSYRNAEIPITELGQTQAASLAQWLREHTPQPDAVFVSPYLRTQQTARPYLEQSSLKAEVLHDLHEFNYLSFAHIDGQNFTRLKQLSEAYWQRNDPDYRDGEDCDSFASFYRRIADTRAHFRRLPDGNYTVFGHGFWIGLLLWQLIGRNHGIDMHHFRTFELQVRPRNTEVFLLRIDDTDSETITKIRRLHDQEHLEAA